MASTPPLLFALEGSQDYASRVAQRLGLVLAEHEEHLYEDGEHKARPLEAVDNRRTVVFHSLYGDDRQSGNDKLCRLLFFCAALKDAGARQVQVVAPYLCYVRKERRTQPQDPVISRYVASLFEVCGVDRLLTLEVHNPAAFDNAFRVPTQNLGCARLFAELFAVQLGDAEVVAVSPDSGGAKRAEAFRRELAALLGRPVGSALVDKHRVDEQLSGGLLVGDVRGRVAILIDDLISTGNTLLRAAEACHRGGAARILVAAAHGLFIAGDALLDSPLLERIVVCDSVPPFRLAPERVAQRLEVLDTSAAVAGLLARQFDLPI